jgi:hypothetical protein
MYLGLHAQAQSKSSAKFEDASAKIKRRFRQLESNLVLHSALQALAGSESYVVLDLEPEGRTKKSDYTNN